MKAKRISSKGGANQGNVQKFDAYKEAFTRIKAAIDKGFFIEAIAIQEAIMSDRLRSHLEYKKSLPKRDVFCDLIKAWKKLGKNQITLSIALPELIDLWRSQRNNAIHGFVSNESNVDVILKNAEIAAKTGLILTRALCNWHRKEVSKNHPKPASK